MYYLEVMIIYYMLGGVSFWQDQSTRENSVGIGNSSTYCRFWFSKANQYLREALAKETVAEEREKLLARIGILEMTANNYAAAVKALNESINIDETDFVTNPEIVDQIVADINNLYANQGKFEF